MKTNFKKIVIVLVIIAIIAGVITYFINKNKKPEYVEYEPQEEISDEQERKTMISLYFVNKTTRNVEPEARMLDVKTLIKDPYTVIINMLIDGPKNENHDNVIPEGTMLIGTSLEGDTLKVNFSSEFVENHIGGKEEEQNNQVDRSSTYSEERRHNSKENTDQYTNNCTVDFIGLDFCLINGIDQSSKCNDQKA